MSKEKEASPDQDEILDCKDCTKTFFTKSGLKIHSRNQHKLKKGSEKKVDQHQQSTTYEINNIDKIYKLASLPLCMSPACPVFHTVESRRLPFNSKM